MNKNRWQILAATGTAVVVLLAGALVVPRIFRDDTKASQEAPQTSNQTTQTSGHTSTDNDENTDDTGHGGGHAEGEGEIWRDNNPEYTKFADVPADQIPIAELRTERRADNGDSPSEGQFRTNCNVSHVNYDDPIVFPGETDMAHQHMFFGNTAVDANTTDDSLLNSGGGSCDGQELNRSGYWMPTLLQGEETVLPRSIVVYYKSKDFDNAEPMPSGLRMISGNFLLEPSFPKSNQLYWSCGDSGSDENRTNELPDCSQNGTLNATVAFPQCWDGVNLDSEDHNSHMKMVGEKEPCPESHPKRLPQVQYLAYWDAADLDHSQLKLSSDTHGGHDGTPGSTLHGDWWGGWNPEIVKEWTDNCIKAARNCSGGQMGSPSGLNPKPKTP